TFDTVSFLTLVDGARITSSKDRFLRACILAKNGLQKLESGETSEFFTPAKGQQSLVDAIFLMEDLIASVNNGAMPLRSFTAQPITLNL
ncbi:MAG TPA: hypothetical protein DF383_00495, partial [Deltaproteobacteria bacterium]|nr:hypothetical protein [Deltaproteobacteria bacterium]